MWQFLISLCLTTAKVLLEAMDICTVFQFVFREKGNSDLRFLPFPLLTDKLEHERMSTMRRVQKPLYTESVVVVINYSSSSSSLSS
jgi:hypothetical protein